MSKTFPELKSRVYKKPKSGDIKTLAKRARAIMKQLDEVKPLYRELDEITLALFGVGDKLRDFGLVVVDNFEEKNTMFKTSAFKRFDLKWTGK